jgi:acyl-CoA reductase-like NAD-dependent aldehyde dehydrogenase
LRDIDGRVELGVKASWRRGMVYTHVVERDAALRHLRDRLRSRPAGETYYERIELGRRVEAALAQLRTTEAAAIMAELEPIAEREAELRPHDDDMIFNRAFLVRRAAEPAFDAAMDRIAERYADRMEFRYVGPLPPFNFVSLQAGWLTAPAGGG